jgi:RNA polymerase sigma-70 factor (family 1)
MIYKLDDPNGEQEVLALLHKDHEKGLKIIFKKYHLPLFYFAMQYLDNSQVAEDKVAESFIKLWDRRMVFTSLLSVKSFLYTSVKNACIDEIRMFNRHSICHKEIEYLSEKTILPGDELDDLKMIKSELLGKLKADIEKLPAARRRIFKMLFLDGLNTYEVARALKISVDTVRVQKARAMHALRSVFNSDHNKSNE